MEDKTYRAEVPASAQFQEQNTRGLAYTTLLGTKIE